MKEGHVDRPRLVSANIVYQDKETDEVNQTSSHVSVQMNSNNIPQKSLIDLERDDTGKTPPLLGDDMAEYTRV